MKSFFIFLFLTFLFFADLTKSQSIQKTLKNANPKRSFIPPPKKLHLSKEYLDYLNKFADKKCNDEFCEERYATNETFVLTSAKRFELRNNAIKTHNKLFAEGKETYKKRLMRWSDWSYPKKLKALCGTRQAPKFRNGPTPGVNLLKVCQSWTKKPPTELNKCNFPNPIRDQQTCGCCWAFASVSIVESQIYNCLNRKTELSVQQLVDCDENNSACDGGWPTFAYLKIAMDGLADWSTYKYLNDRQDWCRKSIFKKVVNPHLISKQLEVELNGDEDCLMKIIDKVGPVTVAVHADEEFMSYGEGFYANDTCPKDDPNHAMVLCGWGTDKVFGDYWLVRNSWGTDWGENGYVRMRKNNTCGIAAWAMWPVLKGCNYLDVFSTGKERKIFEIDENEDVRRRE